MVLPLVAQLEQAASCCSQPLSMSQTPITTRTAIHATPRLQNSKPRLGLGNERSAAAVCLLDPSHLCGQVGAFALARLAKCFWSEIHRKTFGGVLEWNASPPDLERSAAFLLAPTRLFGQFPKASSGRSAKQLGGAEAQGVRLSKKCCTFRFAGAQNVSATMKHCIETLQLTTFMLQSKLLLHLGGGAGRFNLQWCRVCSAASNIV